MILKQARRILSTHLVMIKMVLVASMLTSVAACAEPGPVGNAADGEAKSAICGQCHGKNGISIIPIYPNLAGQKQGYMELQLQAFRSGQRINAAMSPHAKRLTDQDIADLSAYYANMHPAGKKTAPTAQ
jgi:cytochrome c553